MSQCNWCLLPFPRRSRKHWVKIPIKTLIFNCNLFSYTCMNGLSFWFIIKYHCITMSLYIEKIFIISLIVFPFGKGTGSSYKIDNIQIYKVILHPIMIYVKLVLILLVVLNNLIFKSFRVFSIFSLNKLYRCSVQWLVDIGWVGLENSVKVRSLFPLHMN